MGNCSILLKVSLWAKADIRPQISLVDIAWTSQEEAAGSQKNITDLVLPV